MEGGGSAVLRRKGDCYTMQTLNDSILTTLRGYFLLAAADLALYPEGSPEHIKAEHSAGSRDVGRPPRCPPGTGPRLYRPPGPHECEGVAGGMAERRPGPDPGYHYRR